MGLTIIRELDRQALIEKVILSAPLATSKRPKHVNDLAERVWGATHRLSKLVLLACRYFCSDNAREKCDG
jgi:hypothetical protein